MCNFIIIHKKLLHVVFYGLLITACSQNTTPKPNAYLRLDYPKPIYKIYSNKELPFWFNKNELAQPVDILKRKAQNNDLGINIHYPNSIKATIYLTYKPVGNDSLTLIDYLRDAQNITQKHTQKADEISMQPYENKKEKVYGMFYEVGGNAASQSQFYLTDSITHFVTGSLYFYAKPNYDSLLPAANYLKNDIKQIMESFRWKK